MSYKTTNDLMQHLRDNGIAISGETQKQQLVTTGYYHGYKGYRFFKSAGARLPFSSYQELYATIQYDSALKALFYGKMMFIETAVKNIALQGILENAQSESISDVLDRVVCSYNNSPANFTVEQKKRAQQNKLNLQRSIQSSLANAYANGNFEKLYLTVAFFQQLRYNILTNWGICSQGHILEGTGAIQFPFIFTKSVPFSTLPALAVENGTLYLFFYLQFTVCQRFPRWHPGTPARSGRPFSRPHRGY